MDLLLVHAPAFYDFRKENHVYFPFMSTSGDVPITPVYEFYPVGFNTLKSYIRRMGHEVSVFNLCSYMLQNREVDVEECLKSLDAKIIGIDLHWLVHVQGALEVAKRIKMYHKDSFILFGGISSSYYGAELIQYPFVDFVMKGYDTHIPMEKLVNAVKNGKSVSSIDNLYWKDKSGQVHKNEQVYQNSEIMVGMDWSEISQREDTCLNINDIISTTNVGCKFNCGWCGGSRNAFQRIYGSNKSLVYKNEDSLQDEFESISSTKTQKKFNYYSCGSYNLSDEKFKSYLDHMVSCDFRSINFEAYSLMPEDVLHKMVDTNKKCAITLSPESHNQRISKLAGRGNYSMEEMEEWIEKALEIGISQIDIWFFIGMPEQDVYSVFETVKYCEHLLMRFQGRHVVPMICPMMPILDPGSNFFEFPERYGYKLFYKTLEQHRQGMQRASIINRLNYETKWLTREEIVLSGYKAMKELLSIKESVGMLPKTITDQVISKMDDAVSFLKVVHEIDSISDEKERLIQLEKIQNDIFIRNQEVFFSGVMNQAFPVYRKHGRRWFDYIQ